MENVQDRVWESLMCREREIARGLGQRKSHGGGGVRVAKAAGVGYDIESR